MMRKNASIKHEKIKKTLKKRLTNQGEGDMIYQS